jgi:hypothetical protein
MPKTSTRVGTPVTRTSGPPAGDDLAGDDLAGDDTVVLATTVL